MGRKTRSLECIIRMPEGDQWMSEKEKKKGRRAYLNDFEENGEGNYEYRGERYVFVGEEQERKRILRTLMILCALVLVLSLAEGCLPVPGLSWTAYVLIPYAAEIAGAVSCCLAAGRLLTGEYPLRAYVYQSTVKKLPLRTGLTAAAALAVLLLETVYLILNGSGGQTGYIVYFYVLQTAALGCALALFHTQKQMRWECGR